MSQPGELLDWISKHGICSFSPVLTQLCGGSCAEMTRGLTWKIGLALANSYLGIFKGEVILNFWKRELALLCVADWPGKLFV